MECLLHLLPHLTHRPVLCKGRWKWEPVLYGKTQARPSCFGLPSRESGGLVFGETWGRSDLIHYRFLHGQVQRSWPPGLLKQFNRSVWAETESQTAKSSHWGHLRKMRFCTLQWPKKHCRVAKGGFWCDFPQFLGSTSVSLIGSAISKIGHVETCSGWLGYRMQSQSWLDVKEKLGEKLSFWPVWPAEKSFWPEILLTSFSRLFMSGSGWKWESYVL